MDTALANGDFSLGSNGRPKQISGEQELLQRAMIRLNVPLGSFVYNTALGSSLHTLQTDDVSFCSKAEVMAQEALRSLPEITVEGVNRSTEKPNGIEVCVSYGGKTAKIEVGL